MRACFALILVAAGCTSIPAQHTQPRQTPANQLHGAPGQLDLAYAAHHLSGNSLADSHGHEWARGGEQAAPQASSVCEEEGGVDSGRHFETAAHIGLGKTDGCFIRDRHDGFVIEAPEGTHRLEIQVQAIDSSIRATVLRSESFRRVVQHTVAASENWTFEVDLESGEQLFVRLKARGEVPEHARYALVVKPGRL